MGAPLVPNTLPWVGKQPWTERKGQAGRTLTSTVCALTSLCPIQSPNLFQSLRYQGLSERNLGQGSKDTGLFLPALSLQTHGGQNHRQTPSICVTHASQGKLKVM